MTDTHPIGILWESGIPQTAAGWFYHGGLYAALGVLLDRLLSRLTRRDSAIPEQFVDPFVFGVAVSNLFLSLSWELWFTAVRWLAIALLVLLGIRQFLGGRGAGAGTPSLISRLLGTTSRR